MGVVNFKRKEASVVSKEHGGFVLCYRSIQDQAWYNKDLPKTFLFMHCLMNAQHSLYESSFKSNTVTLQAGQLHTTFKDIAEKSGLWALYEQFVKSKDVLNSCKRSIKLSLDYFVKKGMLTYRVVGKSKKTTVITISNWAKFQALPVTDLVTAPVTDLVTAKSEVQQGLATSSVTAPVTDSVTGTVTQNNNVFNNNKDIYVKNDKSLLVRKVIKVFNESFPNLAAVQKITPARKSKLLKIIKDFPVYQKIDTWQGLFDYIEKSDFLMGRASDWQMSFDFMVNPTNFVKIIEGNYENK